MSLQKEVKEITENDLINLRDTILQQIKKGVIIYKGKKPTSIITMPFQFPLWDTLANIACDAKANQYKFQFPLWDTTKNLTTFQMTLNSFNSLYGILRWPAGGHLINYLPFNSLYGILRQQPDVEKAVGAVNFQFPLWDTEKRFKCPAACPWLVISIPFMGYGIAKPINSAEYDYLSIPFMGYVKK